MQVGVCAVPCTNVYITWKHYYSNDVTHACMDSPVMVTSECTAIIDHQLYMYRQFKSCFLFYNYDRGSLRNHCKMASLACSRIEEVNQKAKKLLSQLKASGEMKQDDVIALKLELDSKTFKEEILEECEDEKKSEVNTEVLFSVVSNFYELIECLDLRVSMLTKEIKELRTHLEESAKQLEAWKEDRIQLMIGQLAIEVEKGIIDQVLTEVIGSPDEHYVKTVKDMQKALKRKANFADVLIDDSNHEKATKKWKDLQKTLNWKDIHFRYIMTLKSSRVSVAHPKFEASVVEDAIKENKVGQHKKACKELMKMLEKLQKPK